MPTTEQYLVRLIEWVKTEDYENASDELELLMTNGINKREAFEMITDIYLDESCVI